MSTLQNRDVKLETVPPSEEIVERVAILEDLDQTNLDPLFGAVDPEALNALVSTSGGGDSSLQIEFAYHGYHVTVSGDGGIHIDESGAFDR